MAPCPAACLPSPARPPTPVPETARMAFRDDVIPLKHSGQVGVTATGSPGIALAPGTGLNTDAVGVSPPEETVGPIFEMRGRGLRLEAVLALAPLAGLG